MSKINKKVILTSGVILGIVLSVVVLAGVGIKASEDFRALIANAIGDRIAPQISEALGLGEPSLGLSLPDSANTGLTNVRVKGNLIQRDSNGVDVNSKWERVTLDAADGEFRGSITNSIGSDVILDNIKVFVDGTVSSTFALAAFVSSTAASSLPYNQTFNAAAFGSQNNVIVNQIVVTSTADLVFDNLELLNNGSGASSTVKVADSSYLNIFLKNPYVDGSTNAYGANVSSTARGYDIEVWAHFIW